MESAMTMQEIQYQIGNPQQPNKITQNGIYAGVPMSVYHSDCCDGPSVSKSAIKHILPVHGGSPKAFWGRWVCNPDRIEEAPSKALNFGKAAHCLLLGDEAFKEQFAVRPDHYPNDRSKAWSSNSNDCKAWLAKQELAGRTVVTTKDIEMIRRMAADAAQNEVVKAGALNGSVERTLIAQDPETGIWLKSRPDSIPNASGIFADLKTAGSLDEDFLERQISDAGYYLQGALARMVCRILGIPFDEFFLIYVLKDDVPDTAHARLSEHDLDRGEEMIRWALKTMRGCIESGDWHGARPFQDGNREIRMKPWMQTKIDTFLEQEAAQ